jgi:archaellum component FlaC
MTVWDVASNIIGNFPSVAAGFLLIAILIAVGIFIAGFHKYGLDFIKHGSRQKDTAGLGEKIDGIAARFEEFCAEIGGIHTELGNFHAEMEGIHTELGSFHAEMEGIHTELGSFRAEMEGIHTELEMIQVNHFRHLKNYLGVLNGILLDKKVIDNKDKALLDNELDGM